METKCPVSLFIGRVRIVAQSVYSLRHVPPLVHLSGRIDPTAPLDGFSWNLILWTFPNICRETPNWVVIWQKYCNTSHEGRKLFRAVGCGCVSPVPTGRVFMKFNIVDFSEYLSRNSELSWNLTKISLHFTLRPKIVSWCWQRMCQSGRHWTDFHEI